MVCLFILSEFSSVSAPTLDFGQPWGGRPDDHRRWVPPSVVARIQKNYFFLGLLDLNCFTQIYCSFFLLVDVVSPFGESSRWRWWLFWRCVWCLRQSYSSLQGSRKRAGFRLVVKKETLRRPNCKRMCLYREIYVILTPTITTSWLRNLQNFLWPNSCLIFLFVFLIHVLNHLYNSLTIWV